MFTGLIKELGKIKQITTNSSGKVFKIHAPKLINDINIDDSVATNGVCLTATKVDLEHFYVQAVHVTLKKSNLSNLKVNDLVNLELALRANDRIGGHFVQGHVNDNAKITHILKKGDNWEFSFKCNINLFKYIIAEGSIAIDGISLTVFKVNHWQDFSVSIIPHTYKNTNLYTKKIGDSVNIEVDMFAKYLENFQLFNDNFGKNKSLVGHAQ